MNATVWYYVGILVLLVVLCVGMTQPVREGFGSEVYQYSTMGSNLNARLQPANGIFTNADLPLDSDKINQALNTPDLYNERPIPKDYSTTFVTDPAGMYSEADRQYCKGVTDPRNLPVPNQEKVRCGWLYVDNPGIPSVGAIGNASGPFFPKDAPAGSRWYWNLTEAAKKEDIKYCRRLTSCPSLNGFNAASSRRCGFCTSTGHGVPVDYGGGVLYPDDTGCDEVVTNSDACPVLGGGTTTVGNPDGTQTNVNLCDQRDGNGGLTFACESLQAKQAGMSTQGAVLRGTWGEPTTQQAMRILSSFSTSTMWSDPNAFLTYCMKVVQAQTTGATASIRAAAAYLASDVNVDVCPTDNAATGPFDLSCMQRAFREKGCQPAGSKYPTKAADATSTALKSWGDINTQYTGLHLATQSSDPTVQRPALQECLGVSLPLPPPIQCDWTVLAVTNPWVLDPGPNNRLSTIAVGDDNSVIGISPFTPSIWASTALSGVYKMIPGELKQIDAKSPTLCVGVGTDNNVYQRGTNGWFRIGARAKWVSIGVDGTIVCVNSDVGTMWRYLGRVDAWENIPGVATQIAVGNRSTMWCVNVKDQIYRWNGGDWSLIPGALRRVAVSGGGRAAGVNAQGMIFVYSTRLSDWKQVPGAATNLSISSTYIVATNSGSQIWFKKIYE